MQVSIAIKALSWGAASYALYCIASAFYTSRRNAAKARALKCEEPPLEKNRWPLGIDNLLRALAADRAQQFPVDLIKRFDDLGTNTYRYQVLGGLLLSSLWSIPFFARFERRALCFVDTITDTNFRPGARNIRTADPKNIQAILANKFADFGKHPHAIPRRPDTDMPRDIGPTRRGNFLPMLGDGIFTADGNHWKHSRVSVAQFLPVRPRHLVSYPHSTGWDYAQREVLILDICLMLIYESRP